MKQVNKKNDVAIVDAEHGVNKKIKMSPTTMSMTAVIESLQ